MTSARRLNLSALPLLLCLAAITLCCAPRRHSAPTDGAGAPLSAAEAERIALAAVGDPPDWKVIHSTRDGRRWRVRLGGSTPVLGNHATVDVLDDATARVHPGD